MAAYMMIRIEVDDPSRLKDYQAAAPAIVEKYHGRFIVRGGATVTLEGPPESRRMVVIEFPELSDAEAFYHSPEYAEARKLREGVGVFECVAVDGI
jgi:uncharacterized protein (DUF1330 family)